jgi:UDP-4-amino-4,6-dideoxy-N-acetyl-beta-L-altrosamine transaminase
MKLIPYGSQDISEEDINSVIEILRSDYLTQGPAVNKFETAVAQYSNASHAIAVNSATSALHIACLALDLGKGDALWTSANTFVASANCALYCGAKVDFIDIDPVTYNINLELLEEKLESASKANSLPKIIVPVHLCGLPVDMKKLFLLSQKYGFKIIEDASHAIGAKYFNEDGYLSPIGDCRYSDICIFSFHPVKIITSGEGGMALTNDAKVASTLTALRSHGISREAVDFEPRDSNEIWNYQQILLGFNYRITDIQAALGSSQIMRIDDFIDRRHQIAGIYGSALSNLPITLPAQDAGSRSSYHLYPIRILSAQNTKSQKEIYTQLHAEGILVNLHYIPVYRHPYYEALGFKEGHCPEAEKFHKDALSIPMYPALTEREIERTIAGLTKVFA